MTAELLNPLDFLEVDVDSHFSIHNLPYGVFRCPERGEVTPRVGAAIGDFVLDLALLESRGLLSAETGPLFARSALNAFMAAGQRTWRAVRTQLKRLLSDPTSPLAEDRSLRTAALHRQAGVEMLLPVEIGDYTDFYSSKDHATNVGTMIRGPENALNPNWVHLPVGYHGRAGSIIVSGVDVRRPWGQSKKPEEAGPTFGPCRNLDFELEVGFFVGTGNKLGVPIPIEQAADHIFGMVLVNDWSARDIQAWEYVPLGPFLAKNFATSISPWVVPLEALQPFRTQGPKQDPPPLPHLQSKEPWGLDLNLEVWLQSRSMSQPLRITATNASYLYWNMVQQLAHHTSNGCNTRPGDLMASGTVSGPTKESRGCLLELTWRGSEPLVLPNGEQRRFLEDGDRVVMTGWCQGDGYRVGFGEVSAAVLPALPWGESQ